LFLFTIRKNILSQYEQVSDNVLLHKETGEIVNGPFDIGHIPGWEHRRLEEAAKQLGLTRQEFNDYALDRRILDWRIVLKIVVIEMRCLVKMIS